MSTFSTYDSTVNSFYLAFYGRPADPAGLAFWSQQLANNNGDLGAITQAFSTSEEAQVRFGTDSVAERIAEIYQQLFNRAPDATGLAYWTDVIDKGHASMADVAVNILKGAQGTDAVLADLRQKAVDAFTAQVEADGAAYSGYAAVEAARIVVRAVTLDATAADLDLLVKAAVSFADTATKTPQVVEAIAVNTTLLALFDTVRGVKEPVGLAKALADTAKAAAGDPVTLESLLRGGGMDKVLKVMPAKATLQDVVDALANGGLPAAVEVVYPTAPVTPTVPTTPTPTLKFEFLGVTQGDGHTSSDPVTGARVAEVKFGYTGDDLAAGQRFVYSTDNGKTWSDANLTTARETNIVTITNVDLGKGAPVDAGASSDPHANRETVFLLRAVDAGGQPFASASQPITYDSHAAAPLVALFGNPAAVHFGEDSYQLTNRIKLQVSGLEEGAKVEYGIVPKSGSGAGAEIVWHDKMPDLDDGLYTIAVRQTDAAGNISAPQAISFRLDTVSPVQPRIALAQDTGSNGHDGITRVGTVVIDNLDIDPATGWQYSTDNGANWTFGGRNNGSGKAELDLAKLPEHSGKLLVAQIDAANNVSPWTDALAFTFDNVAPTNVVAFERIEGGAPGDDTAANLQPLVNFTLSGADDGIVEWRLKGSESAWTTVKEFKDNGGFTLSGIDLDNGDQTIELRVVDAAGNVGMTLTQPIHGPYQPPTITATPTLAGLLVASSAPGTIDIGGVAVLTQSTIDGALVGAQTDQVSGLLGLTPEGRPQTLDASGRIYGFGSNGDNVLTGNALWGYGGRDFLTGTTGNDYFSGGEGSDFMYSMGGSDTIWGGAGMDYTYLNRDGAYSTMLYRAGDTRTGQFADKGLVEGMDHIYGAELGDVLEIDSIFDFAPTIVDHFLTDTAAGQVSVVRGVLTNTDTVFQVHGGGASYVVQWTDGTNINSVVFVTHGAPFGLEIDTVAGTMTLAEPPPAPPEYELIETGASLQIKGSITDPFVINLGTNTVTRPGYAPVQLENDIQKVDATGYAGIVSVQGTAAEVAVAMADAATNGVDRYMIYDSKDAFFSGEPGARTFALDGVRGLLEGAYLVNLSETLSVEEKALFDGMLGGDIGKLRAFVDTGVPAAPVVTLDVDTGMYPGQDNDNVSSVGDYTVSNVETNARVQYRASLKDAWTETAPAATPGENTVFVRQVDRAGNASASTEFKFTLDTVKPDAPTLVLADDTGLSAQDKITKVGQVLVGNLEQDGAVFEYRTAPDQDWQLVGAADADGNGVLSLKGEGNMFIEVRQVDLAGNEGEVESLSFVLDKTVPPDVVFSRVAGASPTAPAATDAARASVIFTFEGMLGALDIPQYRIGSSGGWTDLEGDAIDTTNNTLTVRNVSLEDSDPTVEVRIIDVAGNEGKIASQKIDGPFGNVALTATPTADGLELTSPLDGNLFTYDRDGGGQKQVYATGGDGAVAGQKVVIGVQAVASKGMLGIGDEGPSTWVPGTFGFGSNAKDTLTGQYVWGHGGNDMIFGTNGNDVLYGGAGDDQLFAGTGDDVLVGGAGVNRLSGNLGADTYDLTEGENTIIYAAFGESKVVDVDGVAAGFDVIKFSATNYAQQKMSFSMPVADFAGYQYGESESVWTAEAVLTQLNLAYEDLGLRPSSVVLISFADQSDYQFLAVDNGDGTIDGNDLVIKLVGDVPYADLFGSELIFGGIVG